MSTPLHVLIIEDSEDDALLIVRELQRGGYDLAFERVDTPQAFNAALTRQAWDVIIADYSMPSFSGMAALELVREKSLDLPFILVSGTIGEDIAVAAMKAGAHDYVIKDNLARLEPAVRRELQEVKVRQARKRAEQLLQALNQAALAMEKALTPDEIFGVVSEEFSTLGLACTIMLTDESQDRLVPQYLSHTAQELKTAENLLGLQIKDFSIPIDRIDLYKKIIRERQTAFVENTGEIVQQLLPRHISRLAPQLVALLHVPKFIGAPLIVEDLVIGMFSVESADLTRDDTAAITAFAHQVAAAWRKAQLYEQAQQEITERKQTEKALRESEERYRQSVENSPNPIFSVNKNGVVLAWNRACERVFQYEAKEVLRQSYHQLLWAPEDCSVIGANIAHVFAGQALKTMDLCYRCKDGAQRFTVSRLYPLLDQKGDVEECVFANTDITERKHAERLLQALNEAALAVEQALTPEEIFNTVGEEFKKLEFSCSVLLVDDNQDRLTPTYVSYGAPAIRTIEKMLGIKAQDFSLSVEIADIFRRVVWEEQAIFVEEEDAMRQILPSPWQEFASQIVDLLQIGRSISAPLKVEDKVIGLLSVQSDVLTKNDVPAITAFAHQMSAALRKARLMQDLEKSLQDLKQTQTQLIQAQKMEAIGRLAGGVAHDFNNLLTVIQISTQLLMRQLHPQDPLWEHVQQIQEASERATRLTKQLLSFSRRKVVEPRQVNLSEIVSDLGQMLKRVIGEDIELVIALAEDLWSVRADPSQMEQVIVNLAVNARDAMPQGGQLSIQTANTILDNAYAATQIDARPGEHVILTISDTGTGMDDEVQSHIFEPFFTTKEGGQGTGLGLPTVYGIVKQSNGHIWFDSQVDLGTTFKIYLPRAEEMERQHEALSPMMSISTMQGSETILVVEDDASVQVLAVQILKAHGYQTLTAQNGLEAIQLSKKHDGPIHLLLTDVVMPEMSGKELAERLQSQRPELQVLYVSGYSDNVIAHHGILNEGSLFLPKPFTLESLVQKVRTALDETT